MGERALTRVAKGSAYLVASAIITNIISVAAFIVIAHALVPETMALATITLFFIAFGQLLTNVGVSTSVVKFISEARAREEDTASFALGAILGQLSLALCYSAFLAFFADELSTWLLGGEAHKHLFYMASLDVVVVGIFITATSVLVGLDKMREVFAARISSCVVRQGSAVGLILYGLGVVGYVSGWVIGDMAGAIVASIFTFEALRRSPKEEKRLSWAIKKLWRFSWPILITNLANLAFLWFDKLLILFEVVRGGGAGRGELGVYDVAMKAYTAITMVPINISMALFTYYGESYGREDEEAIRSLTLLASRYLSLLFIPTAMGLAVLAGPTLMFFAGERYVGGTGVLLIFGLSGALTALIPMLSYLLITYERRMTFLAANIAAIGGSLVLSPITLPSYGLRLGTALIRGAANILLLIFYLVATKDIVQIDFKAFLKALIGSSIMAGAVYAFQLFWLDVLLLPAYVLTGVLVYAACIRLMRALSDEDVLLLADVFPPRLKKPMASLIGLLAHGSPRNGEA